MKGKKNDFSMTFYNGDNKRLFLEYVHDTDKAIKWVERQGIEWSHAMIYNRRTREKMDRIVNPQGITRNSAAGEIGFER